MLIPVHFTIAGQYKIDNSSTDPIAPGTALKLVADANDEAVVAKADADDMVVGLAADGFRTETISPPASGYAADIVVNPEGDTTRSQNRINDLFRETLGSGLMTVYSGVGTFLTSEYKSSDTFALGGGVYADANGKLTTTDGGGNLVGRVTGLPKAYPNGVPGTDVEGSLSLGTLLKIQLSL